MALVRDLKLTNVKLAVEFSKPELLINLKPDLLRNHIYLCREGDPSLLSQEVGGEEIHLLS